MFAFIRPVLAVTMTTAALLPVSTATERAEAHESPPLCDEHWSGDMWSCNHYRHTPLYRDPNLNSVQVGTTGPYMQSLFSCRVDNGGPSGSPVHPRRWLWHAEGGGWLPDGKITDETNSVRPC